MADWYRKQDRPITDADVGQFVAGKAPDRWYCGYLVPGTHDGRGPRIDTGGVPINEYIAADRLSLYTLHNGPPLGRDRLQVLQNNASRKVVKLPNRPR